jgi:hypothetical protein
MKNNPRIILKEKFKMKEKEKEEELLVESEGSEKEKPHKLPLTEIKDITCPSCLSIFEPLTGEIKLKKEKEAIIPSEETTPEKIIPAVETKKDDDDFFPVPPLFGEDVF